MKVGTVVSHKDGSLGVVKQVLEPNLSVRVDWIIDTGPSRGLPIIRSSGELAEHLQVLGELDNAAQA